MAWLKAFKITRPNTDTSFWNTPDDVKAHIKSNYEDNGKCISFGIKYSEDKLSLTKSRVFNTKSDRDEWEADSTILTNRTALKSYYSDNSCSILQVNDEDI